MKILVVTNGAQIKQFQIPAWHLQNLCRFHTRSLFIVVTVMRIKYLTSEYKYKFVFIFITSEYKCKFLDRLLEGKRR